jgi:hypothetical protein
MVCPIRYPFRPKNILICCLAVACVSGCSSLRRPAPPIDRSEDPRILAEVQSRLADEPSLDATRLRVEVDGRIVILYGSVDGVSAWQCAIRNAQLVTGVATVVDYLVIDRGPRDVVCRAQSGVPDAIAGPQHAPSPP